MIRVDHIGIAARDAQRSALADLFGAAKPTVDGADDDMYRVDLDDGAALLFSTSVTVGFEHIAFRVDHSRFLEIVTRLQERGIELGNDPQARLRTSSREHRRPLDPSSALELTPRWAGQQGSSPR